MAGTFQPAETVSNAAAEAAKYVPPDLWTMVDQHFKDLAAMPTDVGRIYKAMGDKSAEFFPREPDVANLLYAAQVVFDRTAAILASLPTDARKALAEMFAKIHDSPHGHLYNKGG